MGKKLVQPRFRPSRRRARPGVCRWCRCSYFDPCPGGCGWANREQTVCTECVDVDREWKRLEDSRPPNMRRAFFRGFTAGSVARYLEGVSSKRHTRSVNPYAAGRTARFWNLGRDLGLKAAGE